MKLPQSITYFVAAQTDTSEVPAAAGTSHFAEAAQHAFVVCQQNKILQQSF